jgi:hypothetical protein
MLMASGLKLLGQTIDALRAFLAGRCSLHGRLGTAEEKCSISSVKAH